MSKVDICRLHSDWNVWGPVCEPMLGAVWNQLYSLVSRPKWDWIVKEVMSGLIHFLFLVFLQWLNWPVWAAHFDLLPMSSSTQQPYLSFSVRHTLPVLRTVLSELCPIPPSLSSVCSLSTYWIDNSNFHIVIGNHINKGFSYSHAQYENSRLLRFCFKEMYWHVFEIKFYCLLCHTIQTNLHLWIFDWNERP